MARFGRDLVRSLTQPAFMEDVRQAGMLVGSMPARKEKAEKTARLEKGLFGLEQMAASGELTPEMYQEAMGSYASMITDDASAQKIRETMSRVQTDVQSAGQFESISQINAIREKMYGVINNENLPEAEKNKQLSALQIEANTAAKDGRVDASTLMSVGNLTRTVRQDMFNKQEQQAQATRAAEKHGITLEEAERAVSRFEEFKKNANFQELTRQVQTQINEDTLLKSEIRSKGLTRDQFLANYPEGKTYIYDQLEAESLERSNRIQAAKKESEKNKFTYTDEELKSIGFNPAEIKFVRDIAKQNIAGAHTAVISRINRVADVAKPNAAMIGRIADALLLDVMTENPGFDYDDKEDMEKAKAIASQRAMKVSKRMMEGDTFESAVELGFMKDSEPKPPTPEEIISEAMKMLEAQAD